jgi:hypothetical protein
MVAVKVYRILLDTLLLNTLLNGSPGMVIISESISTKVHVIQFFSGI